VSEGKTKDRSDGKEGERKIRRLPTMRGEGEGKRE
jgi:hypothetical protein